MYMGCSYLRIDGTILHNIHTFYYEYWLLGGCAVFSWYGVYLVLILCFGLDIFPQTNTEYYSNGAVTV